MGWDIGHLGGTAGAKASAGWGAWGIPPRGNPGKMAGVEAGMGQEVPRCSIQAASWLDSRSYSRNELGDPGVLHAGGILVGWVELR